MYMHLYAFGDVAKHSLFEWLLPLNNTILYSLWLLAFWAYVSTYAELLL